MLGKFNVQCIAKVVYMLRVPALFFHILSQDCHSDPRLSRKVNIYKLEIPTLSLLLCYQSSEISILSR
jgi:hypothetical protein